MPARGGATLSAPANPPYGTFRSGQYYFTSSAGVSAASLAAGFLYTTPCLFTAPVSIAKIGTEVTIAGGANSVVRIGVWADTGQGYPGTLLLDAGTIDGTSATVQDITLGSALLLGPGLYWFGTAWQVGTAGTVKTSLNAHLPFLVPVGTSKPSAATSAHGYYEASVTGAFGGSFTATPNSTPSNQGPRIHFKTS